MDKLKERLREPSTYAGISLLTLGAGQLFKINEAPAVAGAIENAAPALMSGDYVGGAVAVLSAFAAMFLREGGR